MADDNGLIADIESSIVTLITAATVGGDAAFRTVDNWRGQLQGPDDFRQYAPFAFVEYDGTPNTNPEGDHDLNQHLQFTVRVGTEVANKKAGGRIGKGTDASSGKRQLGVSRLRDVVITALQEVTPTTTDGKTEYFEFMGDVIAYNEPEGRRYAIIMRFRIDRVDSY